MLQRRSLSTVAVVLIAALLVGTAAMTPAVAGDNPTVIYVDDEERTVEAGETTEIDVLVSSQATHAGVGLESISLVGTYDPEILSITDVETAGWFDDAGDGEVQTETDVDDSTGVVTVEQWLEPPGDGAAGTQVFATLTVEVAADAPETETTISFDDSDVQSADEFPQPVFAHGATILVEATEDGGNGMVTSATVAGTAGVGAIVLAAAGFVLYRRRS